MNLNDKDKKERLLIFCDSPTVCTGFGTVAANLFSKLYKHYDVHILGVNHFDETIVEKRWTIHPTALGDIFGIAAIPELIRNLRPNKILLFQDVFIISEIINAIDKMDSTGSASTIPIISYFPIDGAPFNFAYKNVIDRSSKLITYSDFAIQTIHDLFPQARVEKLYHGVDTSVYKPLPPDIINKYREYRGWSNKFIAVNINRFQPRKLIPTTLRIWSMFSKGYKTCNSCGHAYPIEGVRCELCGRVSYRTHGTKKDNVHLYLHMSPMDASMGMQITNSIPSHLYAAGFRENDSHLLSFFNGKIYESNITPEDLSYMYSSANVNITTAYGEGCGLSLLESSACGTRSIAPYNSAIPEQLNGTGTLVKNAYCFAPQHEHAQMRPLVDTVAFVNALEKEYKKQLPFEDKIADIACVNNINTNFQWEDKCEKILRCLKEY